MALSSSEIERLLKTVSGWKYAGEKLVKHFEFKNFKEALAFIQAVGEQAESQNHHPDIHLIDYNQVTLVLWTHSEKGLTKNDFLLATHIDQLR